MKFTQIIKTQYKDSKLYLCDVGARDGISSRWNFAKQFIELISFEPDATECERLKKTKDGIFLNYALGESQGEATLNITKSAGSSSIYVPNLEFLKRFPDIGRFEITNQLKIKVHSLDDVLIKEGLPRLDFIKIDTQGFELNILKGAKHILKESVLGMEVEVGFSPIYMKQPLFRDVDIFIESLEDFELIDLRKTYWKENGTEYIGSFKGQLIFGDALYLRSMHSLTKLLLKKNNKEREGLLIAYMLICYCYGYLDRILILINLCEEHNFLNSKLVKDFKDHMLKKERSFVFPRIAFKIHNFLKFITFSFFPNYKGWVIAERGLGSEKKMGRWIF